MTPFSAYYDTQAIFSLRPERFEATSDLTPHELNNPEVISENSTRSAYQHNIHLLSGTVESHLQLPVSPTS